MLTHHSQTGVTITTWHEHITKAVAKYFGKTKINFCGVCLAHGLLCSCVLLVQKKRTHDTLRVLLSDAAGVLGLPGSVQWQAAERSR